MDYREYVDLDLAIEADKGAYVATVLDSPAGQASTRFDFPFSAPELAQFIVAVGPPRAGARRLAPTGARTTDAKQYGKRLFDSALSGEVGTCFRLSLDRALSSDKGLRIRLRLTDAPELGTIPWEYLFSEPLDRFLTLSLDTPIVRFVDVAQPIEPLLVEPPIRVLVMVSDPKDAPGLDVHREVELLKATTGDLTSSGLMELVFLEDATLGNLQHALYERFHVFHFIGHGGLDPDIGEGVLVFEDAQGMAHRVTGSRLGTLLHDARHMQLAVLNACEGARSSLDGTMASVAQKLVKQGLPAVVAMQFEISDRAAIIFAHEFYFALSRGLPVDAATVEARKAIYISDNEVEWGTPVLFLRTHDARLFELTRHVAAPAPEAHWQSLYDSAVALLRVGKWAAAIPLLEQIAEEKPDFKDVRALLQRAYSGEAAPDGTPPDDAPPDGTPPDDATDVLDETADSDAGPDTVEELQYDVSPDTTPVPERLPDDPKPRRSPMVVVAGVVIAVLMVALGGFGAAKLIGRDDTSPTPEPTLTQRPARGTVAATPVPTPGRTAATKAPVVINRARVLAPYRREAPEIDARDDDWGAVVPVYRSDKQIAPEGRRNSKVSAAWRLAWNEEGLYLFADVTDPEFTPHAGKPSTLWRGDSVSFEFGADPSGLAAKAPLRDSDAHVMLGLVDDQKAIAAGNPVSDADFVPGDELSDVSVAGSRTDSGYTIEAAIPWSVLGVDVDPEHPVFGLNLNVSDAVATGAETGELRAMLSSNGRRTANNQRKPAQWDLLQLVLATPSAAAPG